jgi:hypothetical protein
MLVRLSYSTTESISRQCWRSAPAPSRTSQLTRRDRVLVSGSDGTVNVNGVRPRVRITHAEPADQLTVDTRDGDDVVNSRRLAPGTIGLTIV